MLLINIKALFNYKYINIMGNINEWSQKGGGYY